MPKYKDKSNERIMEVIQQVGKIMAEENRGFIFAPILQVEGNHKTMCAVSFLDKDNTKELGMEEFIRFWGTMSSIIANFNTQLSEEQRKEFRAGFIPFCEATAEQAFPNIKLLNLN